MIKPIGGRSLTLGNEVVETPNMDRLIQSGTLFTHAYKYGWVEWSHMYRIKTMIISGGSIWDANEFRRRWISGDGAALEMTWGRMMHQAGYDTYMTGKWHVDAPADRVLILPGMSDLACLLINGRIKKKDQLPPGYNRAPGTRVGCLRTRPGRILVGENIGVRWSETMYWIICKWPIQSDRRFIYAAFNAPHDPRQSPQAYLDRYQVSRDSVPLIFCQISDKEK